MENEIALSAAATWHRSSKYTCHVSPHLSLSTIFISLGVANPVFFSLWPLGFSFPFLSLSLVRLLLETDSHFPSVLLFCLFTTYPVRLPAYFFLFRNDRPDDATWQLFISVCEKSETTKELYHMTVNYLSVREVKNDKIFVPLCPSA